MESPTSFVDFIDSVASGEQASATAGPVEPPSPASATLMQVAFRQGHVGLVDAATPQGRTWTQVLGSLQQSGAPAYVEVDPGNRLITKVLLPLVVNVGAITPTDDGVEVELLISHARHFLRKSQPGFDRLLATLEEAQAKGTRVTVTETPLEHDIFAVDLLAEGDGQAPSGTAPGLSASSPVEPAGEGEADGPVALATVSLAQAQRLFDLVDAQTCYPADAASPCIPFVFPDDGCWARAHEMYRLMAIEGVLADKVWIYGNLRVATSNHPHCEVRWSWHVAPTLLVDTGGGRTETHVIDPALFRGPVPQTSWAGVQGDPDASLVPTAGSVFYRSPGGLVFTDRRYSYTQATLARFRIELRLRAGGADGPPPYSNCLPVQPELRSHGAVAPGAMHPWLTFGWPAHWHVLWSVMPLAPWPGAVQLWWRNRVGRTSENLATYWIMVTHAGRAAVGHR